MCQLHGPTELAEEVIREWEEVPGLPDAETIRAIITQSYRLSFATDEGRYPRLLLAALAAEPPDRLSGPFVPLGNHPLFWADIVAVAPAIAPPPFALVLSDGSIPMGLGIIDLTKIANTPGIYFGIRGPGDIEVATYRNLEKRSWILSRGMCQEAKDLRESSLFVDLCEAGAERAECSRDFAVDVIRHLAYTVSRRGHGGTLLVIDGDSPASATAPKIDFARQPLALLQPRNLTRRNEAFQTATIISCLTQIDGAVLLDSHLRVKGAGVFLDHGQTSMLSTTGDSGNEKVKLDGLGSRHRSAAWFCERNRDARAIVISTDQAIRVFGHSSSEFVCNGPYVDSMIPIGDVPPVANCQ